MARTQGQRTQGDRRGRCAASVEVVDEDHELVSSRRDVGQQHINVVLVEVEGAPSGLAERVNVGCSSPADVRAGTNAVAVRTDGSYEDLARQVADGPAPSVSYCGVRNTGQEERPPHAAEAVIRSQIEFQNMARELSSKDPIREVTAVHNAQPALRAVN